MKRLLKKQQTLYQSKIIEKVKKMFDNKKIFNDRSKSFISKDRFNAVENVSALFSCTLVTRHFEWEYFSRWLRNQVRRFSITSVEKLQSTNLTAQKNSNLFIITAKLC